MRSLYTLPLLALLAGCATTGHRTPGDPYEGINRKMWAFDRGLDKAVMKPAGSGYRAVMPAPIRHGLSNMLSNVSEPFSFINAVLQGKPKRALNTMGRFVINTTIGIGGFRDVASKVGYPQAMEDLGQTFAVWGAKKSTYVVLPFYGPSTIRDAVGTFAAQWVDPYRVVIRDRLSFWPATGLTLFQFVDARANLIDSGADTLLDSSADSYAVARSAYLQHRQAQIDDSDDGAAAGDDAALNAALEELGPDQGHGSAPASPTEPTPPQPDTPRQPAAPEPQPAPASNNPQ